MARQMLSLRQKGWSRMGRTDRGTSAFEISSQVSRRHKCRPNRTALLAAAVGALATAPACLFADVTGANGADGANGTVTIINMVITLTPGQPGGAGGNATDGQTTNNPENTAKATGGNG